MEIDIRNETKNVLFDRKEIIFVIDHSNSVTPSREQVRKEAASHFKADESLIVVQYIHSSFGMGKSSCKIHVYSSEENMMKYEPHYLLVRNKMIEEKKEEVPASA